MGRSKFIWQLYPSFLLVTMASLVLVAWYGSTAIQKFYFEQMAAALASKAHIAAAGIQNILGQDDADAINRYCKETGKNSRTRITVVSLSGKVLGDSEEDPAGMENHADRPEIIAAVAGKTQSAIRFSSTLQKNMMYVAVPLLHRGEAFGVIRSAVSTASIDEALGGIQARIVLACLVVCVLVTLISWVLVRHISRPLEEVRKGVERFARGDFSQKLTSSGTEEIASLAQSMNYMARELDGRMKAILSQRNELEAVFASMIEGVLVFDREKRFLSINKAGAELFGVNVKNVVGKAILEVVRNRELQEFINKTLHSVGPIEGEVKLSTAGDERFFQAHGVSLPSMAGDTIGGLIVVNDVTRLRKLEKLRRDFVANVSHELKTPITSIQGFAETLLEGALDHPENLRNFLEIIAKQSRKLTAIIEDLLTLSRLERDMEEISIDRHEYPVIKVITAASQSCQPRAERKQIQIRQQCGDELTAFINPQLLEQAVTNLIDNAIKYGPAESEILVACEKAEDGVRIAVHDNGPGIASEHQPRIFERFYRVDKARSRDAGGTGLGLSIVKHIVQAHGGMVALESTLGRGSVFTLHIPGREGV